MSRRTAAPMEWGTCFRLAMGSAFCAPSTRAGATTQIEKASAGVLASSDLSAFLKPFARDRLAQLPPAPTTEETLRNQFLAHVRTTGRAMATASGAILASCPELNGLKPVTAEALTIQVTNRTHLLLQSALPSIRRLERCSSYHAIHHS